MSLNVRSIVEEDLGAVESIANQFEYNSWSHAVFADCMKTGYHGWVLVDECDSIQGFLVVLVNDGQCQIMNIGVTPSCQRNGYGRQLLNFLLSYLQQQQCTQIILEVRASNLAAIRLYESMGFCQVGVRSGYYPQAGRREDALVYSLEISANGNC